MRLQKSGASSTRLECSGTDPRSLGRRHHVSSVISKRAHRRSISAIRRGVYLLHDTQGVVYVGRTTDQNMGRRLYQHTVDRMTGRWNRFSWFGVYPVEENGNLKTVADFSGVDISIVIATMEAVLIEGLEPRQNRKRGDDFQAVEFLQFEDPELSLQRERELLQKMMSAKLKPPK